MAEIEANIKAYFAEHNTNTVSVQDVATEFGIPLAEAENALENLLSVGFFSRKKEFLRGCSYII